MRREYVLWPLVMLLLCYPAVLFFQAMDALAMEEALQAERNILEYQISAWICWVFYAGVAVYYKWVKNGNEFFYFTYAFVVVAFGLFGYLHQSLVNQYSLSAGFRDNYSFGLLMALKSIVSTFILTVGLQAAVWWFTHKWHR